MKHLETLYRELNEYGIKPKTEIGGKHVHIRWSVNGHNYTYTTSCTPSDHRAMLNARSDIRRILRTAGAQKIDVRTLNHAITKPEFPPRPRSEVIMELRSDVDSLTDLVFELAQKLNGSKIEPEPTTTVPTFFEPVVVAKRKRTLKIDMLLNALSLDKMKTLKELSKELNEPGPKISAHLWRLKKNGYAINLNHAWLRAPEFVEPKKWFW